MFLLGEEKNIVLNIGSEAGSSVEILLLAF